MFSVGQKVWQRGGQRSGTVLECDGGRVFIAQDNGAELEFLASDLTATPPAANSQGAEVRDNARTAKPGTRGLPSRTLMARDITSEHSRVLGIVPVRALQAITALYEARPGAGRFSALDVAGKLNVIEEITAVPYRVLRDYSDRPGELGLLMGKGLADSRKT